MNKDLNDRDQIHLLRIYELCEAIERTIIRFGDDLNLFCNDMDYQNSVCMSLFQIGEVSNALSDGFKEQTEREIEWHKIRGIRNVFAHNYGAVNMEIIWTTCKKNIPELKIFCERYV